MHEFSLTDGDLEAIDELSRRAAVSKSDGMVSWWSAERRLLWMRLFVLGRPCAWVIVPAEDADAAARQRDAWADVIAINVEHQAQGVLTVSQTH